MSKNVNIYSEPTGSYNERIYLSKKTVPDMPDNSSAINFTGRLYDHMYKCENKENDVEMIPTQGGEAPKESLLESEIPVRLASILESLHADNVELDKRNVFTDRNRNNLAREIRSLRKIRDKDRRKANSTGSEEVKEWRNRSANTADNLAREKRIQPQDSGKTRLLQNSPYDSKSRVLFGNKPRVISSAKQ